MTLKALFALPIFVIVLVTVLLAGMIVSREWHDHRLGTIAIAAATRAEALTRLESQLTNERDATWQALEAGHPLPEPEAQRLAAARVETNRAIEETIALPRTVTVGQAHAFGLFLIAVQTSLALSRAQTDALVKLPKSDRTYEAFINVMPRMLGPSALFGPQLGRAGAEAISSEPELAGIIAVARIGLALREELVAVAGVVLPRINAGEKLTEADLSRAHALLARADVTTNLLEVTFYLTDPPEKLRALLKDFKEAALRAQLDSMLDSAGRNDQSTPPIVWSSGPMVELADRVNRLRTAIIQETVRRAVTEQASRTARLNLALAAVGAVTLIILTALVMLQRSVVRPLAQLGVAITRIANGDRRTIVSVDSATHEIAAILASVESLRKAALVADATLRSQHEAEERRLLVLREALGILRTVAGPSHALERVVACLSDSIDAILAAVIALPEAPPPTLEAAAIAVRTRLPELPRLPELQDAARQLVTTIELAHRAEDDGLPEAEIIARILSAKALADRRNAMMGTFIQPCLIALRDTRPLAGNASDGTLRNLIGEQFRLIESIVETMASLLAEVTRATAIARGLPLDTRAVAA